MRLKLKDTPEQNALIQALGSKNMAISLEAQEAFAKFMGPVIQILLQKAGTASRIYTDAPYNADTDNPSYPLDLYYDQGVGFVNVWSQNVAGGLPTSEIWGLQEMKIATYRLDSAVSFNKRYARKCRLDVVAKGVERMAQEVLVKQEINAWATALKALAEANSPYSTETNHKHIVGATSSGVFTFGDLNNLFTLVRRINSSFDGGTAVEPYSEGPTDIYTSPEIMQQIRAMAYNPLFYSTTTWTSATWNTQTQLPNSVREDLWKNPGTANFFGTNFIQLNEFGAGHAYNTLFNSFTTSQNVPGPNSDVWNSTRQILVAIDNKRGAFIRPVARDSDTGSTFTSEVDDQYNLKRVDKAGFYGSLEEGRVVIDARAVGGIVI
jgi:hypothetical protein